MSMEIQLSRRRTQGHKDRSIKVIWSDEKKKKSKAWRFMKYFEMNQCDVLSAWQTLGSLGRWASGHAGWRSLWLYYWARGWHCSLTGILDWVEKGSPAVLPDWDVMWPDASRSHLNLPTSMDFPLEFWTRIDLFELLLSGNFMTMAWKGTDIQISKWVVRLTSGEER